jgi:glucose/arabinose dehydrogenase
VFATALRNPVGMAWEAELGALSVAVNQRDEIGNELVPDYMKAVKENGFYGWPSSYYGAHVDDRVSPRLKPGTPPSIQPDLCIWRSSGAIR